MMKHITSLNKISSYTKALQREELWYKKKNKNKTKQRIQSSFSAIFFIRDNMTDATIVFKVHSCLFRIIQRKQLRSRIKKKNRGENLCVHSARERIWSGAGNRWRSAVTKQGVMKFMNTDSVIGVSVLNYRVLVQVKAILRNQWRRDKKKLFWTVILNCEPLFELREKWFVRKCFGCRTTSVWKCWIIRSLNNK